MNNDSNVATSNCWLSATVFSCVGALLFFGCRARAEELGFGLLFDENAKWIVMGIISGEGALILGGALFLAAILIAATGKSKGSNAGTVIGTTIIVLSAIGFAMTHASDLDRRSSRTMLDTTFYGYLGGVAILFIGLVSGPSETRAANHSTIPQVPTVAPIPPPTPQLPQLPISAPQLPISAPKPFSVRPHSNGVSDSDTIVTYFIVPFVLLMIVGLIATYLFGFFRLGATQ